MIKTLWASVMESPVFMRRVNGWLAVFWVLMIPVSYYMGWLASVTYVSALSLWALVSGHWSAWQAARVEVKQEIAEGIASEDDEDGEAVEEGATSPGSIAHSADLTITGHESPHAVGDTTWYEGQFGFHGGARLKPPPRGDEKMH